MSLCLDDPMYLSCKRGDLLLVDKDDQYSSEEDWVRATNQRTSSSGAVNKETLHFLPTLNMPTDELLVKLLLHPVLISYLPIKATQGVTKAGDRKKCDRLCVLYNAK